MKFVRSFAFVLSLSVGSILAHAQTPPAAAAPATKAPAAPAKVSAAKGAAVVWINTAAFTDENAGIKALVKVNKELELEFSGQQGDLQLLQEKLRTIVTELQALRSAGEAKATEAKAKQEEGMKLQQELQQKGQEFQAALQRAQQEKQGPIAGEIGKALNEYIKDNGIGLVLDVTKLNDAILASKPELDITAEFVAYYNAVHP